MKNISIFLSLSLLVLSCSKDKTASNEPAGNNPPVESFGQLQVPASHNWSASIKGMLNISVTAPGYLETEGQEVQLITESGKVLARNKVRSSSASFRLSLPSEAEKVYAYLPNTGTYQEVTQPGNITLSVADFLAEDPLADANSLPFDISPLDKKSTESITNVLINGDFEADVDSSYDGTLASMMGNWQMLTQLKNARIKIINGSRALGSSNSNYVQFGQVVTGEFRRKYDFKFKFAGESNGRLYYYNKDGKLLGYAKPSRNSSTGTANVRVTLSADIHYIEARIFTKGTNGWIDDVELGLVAEPDTDNDGVVDRLDDFPNDATKAFASFFPLIGRQTLAFEDLWPSTGDFDFNDMVLSNLVTFGADANGKLVDARFQVKVNAMGAGVANGIGIKFYRPDGSSFNTNIIGSFAGEGALDPQVQNGVIVIDNAKTIRPIYWNTGVGPDATPKEFDFTITFNGNMDENYVLPDLYIFRSAERGREIHLAGFSGTEAADPSHFSTGKDVNGTYLTKENYPWAIEILYPGTIYFNHPREKVDITQAYPYFQQWAESAGKRYSGWMVIPANGKVYEM